jgi:hypothetical protein
LDNLKRNISVTAVVIHSIGEHKKLIQLLSDPIESPFDSILVRECSGIIIEQSISLDDNSSTPSYKCAALPLMRFFDFTDKEYVDLEAMDWKSVRVYEKLDGHSIILFFYDEEWRVAVGSSFTYTSEERAVLVDMFWNIWKSKKYSLPGMTFIHEFSTEFH